MAQHIQCKSLTKSFKSLKALNSFDLELSISQPTGIVGPNGAGKSTLFSILCGFIKPSSGEVLVMNAAPDSSINKGKLSLLPQDTAMFKGIDVFSQLKHYARLQGLNKHAAIKEVEHVLSLVQGSSFSKQYPETLSFGQRKRVMLAQSLIGKPELILMDEPTSGLDPVAATEVRNLLRQLGNEYSVIISSHNLTEIEDICSDIVIMDKGKLITHSSLSELTRSNQCFSLGLENVSKVHLSEILGEINGISRIENDTNDMKSWLVYFAGDSAESIQIKILSALGEHKIAVSELKKGKALADEISAVIKNNN
ncbi:MAG: ABC transporter ATP-binding protein [Proteobacteria bacterium]|nr:ABC transporter ATP-binding protein [Pseudomonadota bacterium]NOG59746.1 ABC transporter ATP-binding protein [Pseudomonadota bacterium]